MMRLGRPGRYGTEEADEEPCAGLRAVVQDFSGSRVAVRRWTRPTATSAFQCELIGSDIAGASASIRQAIGIAPFIYNTSSVPLPSI